LVEEEGGPAKKKKPRVVAVDGGLFFTTPKNWGSKFLRMPRAVGLSGPSLQGSKKTTEKREDKSES